MIRSAALLFFLLAPSPCSAFTVQHTGNAAFLSNGRTFPQPTRAMVTLQSSPSDEDARSQSRLEGMSREPTVAEISTMDDMITKLADAKPYELPNAVSRAIRVISSPRFFLRIAERADMATDDVEKEKLSALAENLVSTLDAVVSTTEDRLDERAKEVESVVKAAAEPDSGEFLVPLTPERVGAMQKTLRKLDPVSLDEGFLSTVDAWMNKSHQDGMDGMVEILQKVLQIYAGTAITRARAQLQANVGAAVSGQTQEQADEVLAQEEEKGPSPAASFLEELMKMDTDLWDSELRSTIGAEGELSPATLMGEVQRTIEGVVLGLENGSMAQRVQAEYLRELVSRIEAIEQSQ
uniref:Plastid lipid-associated protein/fibrillin conserved domain-containing protein n=2 Tax=Helicotheca tamesis TaxID=374047 RepID=A0A7S2MXP2_9STRA|mmetsp:Transcript_5336/g.7327  ORF Transcript_5336/g.7327 Transcript_5336/m.7327 type:complete len:351 (+) Transcript_5336:61-1113(+)|eukprot:CAMPEP_0185728610 /NCGR_PEP_ID=MMETSP1171-20130828/3951_1 /TAXON_ID=374046 /ORGANISM="Helicotheca tamensis, Strain CCMP826" /LENGTH=350 /DNA_ID=CAMNT_0028397335 /DNA_START=13 /DNA_END=1065 /DNA_ORIENTATION=+